jgi:cell division septum initiation protein DivIVA
MSADIARIRDLEQQNAELREQVAELEEQVARLEEQVVDAWDRGYQTHVEDEYRRSQL